MKKISLLLLSLWLTVSVAFAKEEVDSLQMIMDMQSKFIDSVETSLHWETKQVSIGNGIATLKLKDGFKYLNAEQSKYVLHDLWGNPPREDVLGMIFPANGSPFADSSYAFLVSFDEDGYVKDDDAEDIDYDDMLKEMKKSEPEMNKQRAEAGYEPLYFVGWASKPYYDKDHKVLHWAKELQFGDDSDHTLNYDVRVLGRRGVLSLNAIATMSELPLVKANINDVLDMPEFTEGNRYSDFNSSTDKVAEYGIGALVAGSILAKTGFFAMIGKFLVAAWKFIVLGLVAAFGAIKRFFTGRKKSQEEDEPGVPEAPQVPESTEA